MIKEIHIKKMVKSKCQQKPYGPRLIQALFFKIKYLFKIKIKKSLYT